MLCLIDTLRELISIASVNPMGREFAGPDFLEGRLTDYLEDQFQRIGVPSVRQSVEPGRENIVARLDGEPGASAADHLLLWEVHQDTVPVEGMTIEPFHPEVREGRMYGRGACDVKGSMAAMLCALSRLVETRPSDRATVLMACTVNEEFGFTGASALTRLWSETSHSLVTRRPDAAIVAEPTELNAVVAHKGVVRWRCHTRGRAVHSSEPDRGENAIYRMGKVLAAIDDYQRKRLPTWGEHPRCGRPSASVGTITGGISVNTVPDRATIEIDRRLLPDEDPEQAYQHLIDAIDEQAELGDAVEHDPPFSLSPGLPDEKNGWLADRLVDLTRRTGAVSDRVGVSYGTDAAVISAAGVPTVVYGPGSIQQAHTADEWIDLNQLELGCELYYQSAAIPLT